MAVIIPIADSSAWRRAGSSGVITMIPLSIHEAVVFAIVFTAWRLAPRARTAHDDLILLAAASLTQPGKLQCRARHFDIMKNTLDAKDHQIIDLLKANARRPLVALAKEIGLSRSAAQERLQRLETSGVIRGYTVEVVWPDDHTVEAWLTVRLDSGVSCIQVVPQILKAPTVRLCHALAGDIDILIRLCATSADEVSRCRDELSAVPGICSVTTHVVLAAHR